MVVGHQQRLQVVAASGDGGNGSSGQVSWMVCVMEEEGLLKLFVVVGANW